MWTHAQLLNRSHSYVLVAGFSFDHQVDEVRLNRAVEVVVKRHELLRTSFHFESGELRRRVHVTVDSGVSDLGHLADGAELLGALLSEPIAIDRAPLLKVGLSRHHSGSLVVIALHHLISDGWSFANLLRDIEAAYATDDPDFSELEDRFARFVEEEELLAPANDTLLATRSPGDGSAMEAASGEIEHLVLEASGFAQQVRSIALACKF